MKISKNATNKGFGLMQLLVAIVAIVIIAHVAAPQISNFTKGVEVGASNTNLAARDLLKPVFFPGF